MKLNFGTGVSPSWRSQREKSIERPFSRQGVPVLKRSTANPSRLSDSETSEVASPIRPPFSFRRPTCISPRMKVPALRITDLPADLHPEGGRDPGDPIAIDQQVGHVSLMDLDAGHGFEFALHAGTGRPSCRTGRAAPGRRGPLEALSIRHWMPVASVLRPMIPPSASISRTM